MPTTNRPIFLWILLLVVLVVGVLAGIFFLRYSGPQRIEIKDSDYDPQVRFEDMPRQWKTLMCGGTHHGGQFTPPPNPRDRGHPEADFSRRATTYYHRQGPLGMALERYNWWVGPENTYAADARLPAHLTALCWSLPGTMHPLPCGPLVAAWSEPPLGMVLLNTGTIASYARPYQYLDIYESDDRVIELSQPPFGKPLQFTFVDDAAQRGARTRILPGPERTAMQAKGPRGFYQVLVVNTIRGDPGRLEKDLLTREALQLYLCMMRDDGVICFHTSNRYFDLKGLLADLAADAGLAVSVGSDAGQVGVRPIPPSLIGHFSSEWILLARTKNALASLPTPAHHQANIAPFWTTPAPAAQPIWTDDGGNSLDHFRRPR